MLSLRKRFDKKVIKSDGCWIWDGALVPDGYGSIRYGDMTLKAHRASYMLYVGNIPNGMCVLHKCDNRKCVNPDHLELGSMLKNMRDAAIRERWDRKLKGHEVIDILTSDESGKYMCEKYGVSKGMVSMIRNGKTWKHINSVTRA